MLNSKDIDNLQKQKSVLTKTFSKETFVHRSKFYYGSVFATDHHNEKFYTTLFVHMV